ncbi:hypothetical protein MPSEU_000824100 [Mayamaea pseudoterrestris]|nr:hypothetical protein MPSEU_000824100 [Mayamaea pseudoterrestris]
MTEVRNIGDNNQSLFATQSYKEGDVILEEAAPLVRLGPTLTLQQNEASLFAQFNSGKSLNVKPTAKYAATTGKRKSEQIVTTPLQTFYDSISVPSDIVEPRLAGTFRSMVQAATCFACATINEDVTERLLKLYHPSLIAPATDEEKAIVTLAQQALSYMQANAREGSKLQQLLEHGGGGDLLVKVMLIYSCNSFEGGRIYERTSRINHSCDPNAVVNVDGNEESQRVLAATNISVGDEITISYLGTMLYSDKTSRRERLRRDKHFICQCARCVAAADLAARVPCNSCHPRPSGQRQLDEDVQYDDERTVHYMAPNGHGLYTCERCSKILDVTIKTDEQLLKTIQSVTAKVSIFINDNLSTKPASEDNDQEADMVQQTLREQHLELASSFLGASHWTTNLLLLMQLTQLLENLHAESLLETSTDSNSDVDMDTIAQGIDMLERLVRFVDGLQLALHRGHLLSDVVIGMARALVSLGDVKSQKYAVEWLDKLDDYVEKFESEGMCKVVTALKVAWTRGDDKKQKLIK